MNVPQATLCGTGHWLEESQKRPFSVLIVWYIYYIWYNYDQLSLSTRGSISQTESPPSNYYIGGSTCMTSMYRVANYIINAGGAWQS